MAGDAHHRKHRSRNSGAGTSGAKDEAIEQCPPEFEDFISDDDTIHHIAFPAISFPDKVNSLNLDREKEIEGVLEAIKGQYFLLDGGRVFNVRRHSGYRVEWAFG